jgi:hypothetical protein
MDTESGVTHLLYLSITLINFHLISESRPAELYNLSETGRDSLNIDQYKQTTLQLSLLLCNH